MQRVQLFKFPLLIKVGEILLKEHKQYVIVGNLPVGLCLHVDRLAELEGVQGLVAEGGEPALGSLALLRQEPEGYRPSIRDMFVF